MAREQGVVVKWVKRWIGLGGVKKLQRYCNCAVINYRLSVGGGTDAALLRWDPIKKPGTKLFFPPLFFARRVGAKAERKREKKLRSRISNWGVGAASGIQIGVSC